MAHELTFKYAELLDESAKIYDTFHKAPDSERFKIYLEYLEVQNEIVKVEAQKPSIYWCNSFNNVCPCYQNEEPIRKPDVDCDAFVCDGLEAGVCAKLKLLFNSKILYLTPLKLSQYFSTANPLCRRFTIKEYLTVRSMLKKFEKES